MAARGSRPASDRPRRAAFTGPGLDGHRRAQEKIELFEKSLHCDAHFIASHRHARDIGARPTQPGLDLCGDIRVKAIRGRTPGIAIERGEACLLHGDQRIFECSGRPAGLGGLDLDPRGRDRIDGILHGPRHVVIHREAATQVRAERHARGATKTHPRHGAHEGIRNLHRSWQWVR